MKVIYDAGRIKRHFKKSMLAIGVFDGLHLGHRYLIKQMIKKSKLINGTSIVMTFFPHPIHVLKPQVYLPFLVSLKHRLKLIEEIGVDVCIIIRFTKKFSNLTPKNFVKKYLVDKIHPKEVFVGNDFAFGKNRGGDIDFLKKEGEHYNFKVTAISPVKRGNRVISSTRIRKLITTGKIDVASELLGRPVSVLGEVRRGDARGKILGFPTANIYPAGEIIPPRGVYLVKVTIDKKMFQGIANVGERPSFKKGNVINIEVHIFNFNRDIYEKEIEIMFLRKIRNERKFSSKDTLIDQLKKDEKKAKILFKKIV